MRSFIQLPLFPCGRRFNSQKKESRQSMIHKNNRPLLDNWIGVSIVAKYPSFKKSFEEALEISSIIQLFFE